MLFKSFSNPFAFLLLTLSVAHPLYASEPDYSFDGKISREVLCNYLARSTTFGELLNSDLTEKFLGGDVDDNIRMLTGMGAKFAGRSIYMWGDETRLESLLASGQIVARKIHDADPDVILQAAVFEIVTAQVNQIPIPAWVFEDFDQSPETRNFKYEAMLYPEGHRVNHWGPDASVPDMSRLETRMWFYYLTARYIDIGVECIHFGQVELMDDNDPDRAYWSDMLTRCRRYASQHARRRLLLCDAHVPSGGIVLPDGRLLFDFHSFPLRIEEIPGKPEHAVLKLGYRDSLFKRSKGGVTPSGWRCDSLPYIVELDNFGGSGHEGENYGGHWCWGYDEITWFANQSQNYRDLWLHYAWNWIRKNDPNGYLQMPAGRVLYREVNGRNWYWANRPSDKVPGGFNQEETIKWIWENDS
ncbi:MAG: hypothetical protein JXR73_14180 [Candidatus Omnitrophica bacterium]|nr:hypothetical protein [Candidatus Omnitrophota bacterium]